MRQSAGALARACVLLAAALACGAPVRAQSGAARPAAAPRYDYDISPPELAAGGTALLILRIEGMTAASLRVDAIRLSPGLGLETQAIRPYVMKGGVKGSELRLGFILREAGTQRIESLSLVSAEGSLSIGPIQMIVREAAGSGGAAPRPVLWVWKAPESAFRYEAFEAALERADGGEAAKGLAASFEAPAGATVEASGYLRWTIVALEAGRLALPDATLVPAKGSSGRRGEAEAAALRIDELPQAVRASRAVGKFGLRLEGPDPARPIAGGQAEFALRLEGSGNFPCLVLPEPEVLLDGAPLGKGAWSSRRVDDSRPSASGYSGSAGVLVEVLPPGPGILRLRFPPLAVLGPDGKVGILEAAAVEVEVGPAKERAPAAEPGGLAPGPESFGPTAEAARLLWERGERGAALASLYATMRRRLPFELAYREAKAASSAIAASLARAGGQGAGDPLLDALPPPRAFIAVAAVALVAAFAVLLASAAARRRRRDRGLGPRPYARAAALVLSIAALVAIALGGVSALERRESYAVVWTEELSVIPSSEAELRIRVSLGSTARLRAESPGFAGLSFADGVEAWAPSKSVFFY